MNQRLPDDLFMGCSIVDQQHAELLDCAEQLMNALVERRDVATALRIHSYLTDYSSSHFAQEEKIMARFNYPDRIAHVAAHEVFKARLRQIENEIGTWGTSFELMTEAGVLLPDLLLHHVREHDIKLARFLREHDRSGMGMPDSDGGKLRTSVRAGECGASPSTRTRHRCRIGCSRGGRSCPRPPADRRHSTFASNRFGLLHRAFAAVELA